MKHMITTLILVFLAVVKVIADLAGWQSVSALAAVTNAAPAMKVFTAHNGYETFSSSYDLTIVLQDGSQESLTLNPTTYQGLQGPYNRRNVYGAAIAYGPILSTGKHTHSMWSATARYAFCDKAVLRHELPFQSKQAIQKVIIHYGVSEDSNSITEQQYPNHLEVQCYEA